MTDEIVCNTIGELIEKLKEFPPETIWIGGRGGTVSWITVCLEKESHIIIHERN